MPRMPGCRDAGMPGWPPGGAGTGEEGEEGEEGGKKEGRKRLWKASNGLGRLENAIGMHA